MLKRIRLSKTKLNSILLILILYFSGILIVNTLPVANYSEVGNTSFTFGVYRVDISYGFFKMDNTLENKTFITFNIDNFIEASHINRKTISNKGSYLITGFEEKRYYQQETENIYLEGDELHIVGKLYGNNPLRIQLEQKSCSSDGWN